MLVRERADLELLLTATPGTPYDSSLQDLLTVEPNMRLRRLKAKHTLADNEEPLPIGSYPLLGVPGFVESSHKPLGPVLRSLFLPDSVMYPHPRFGTLSGNIRKRRGSKVQINIPIFHDTNTPQPFIDPDVAREGKLGHIDQCDQGAALDDHIYMDAMGFGMGCCCIQMTLQAGNVQSARKLFDHLAPLGAILMALSASTPCYRGYLSDIDCRWDVIGASVDCRTRQERGLEPLTTDRYVIPKSRYGTIDAFLSSDDGHFKDEYNDLGLVYNEEAYKRLRESGVDFNLARHIAHLFIRDPIVIFEELLDQDNTKSSDHFENIQSTNWQNVRFKPPSPDSATGWRVEFRTGEIQFTDFENAALAVFVNLLGRAILAFNLNFYIPVTRMDVNMARAHRRDAVNSAKFYFRKQ
ncbi:glutamate--cysteine ligase, partial [Spiromyces aspiralis]